MSHPKAPSGLSDESKTLWSKIHEEYIVDQAVDIVMLERGLHALDLARAAEAQLRDDGPTVLDRFDKPKAHPCAAIARDSRAQFCAIMRQMEICPHPNQKGK